MYGGLFFRANLGFWHKRTTCMKREDVGGGQWYLSGCNKKKRWDRINTDVQNLEHRQNRVCITWHVSGTAALMWNIHACVAGFPLWRWNRFPLRRCSIASLVWWLPSTIKNYRWTLLASASLACLKQRSWLHVLICTDEFLHFCQIWSAGRVKLATKRRLVEPKTLN